MAIEESGYVSPIPPERPSEPVTGRAAIFRRISWGAVFAGVFIVLAIQLLLNVLGLGIGVLSMEPAQVGEEVPRGLGIAAGIWWLVASLIALFAGGWVAARLAGPLHWIDSGLHGLVTWSLATLIGVFLLVGAMGSVVGGAWTAMRDVAMVRDQIPHMGGMGGAMGQNQNWQRVEQDLRTTLQQRGGVQYGHLERPGQAAAQADPQVSQALRRYLEGGAQPAQREEVITQLTSRTNMSRSDAEQAISRWEQSYRQGQQQEGQATGGTTEQRTRQVAQRVTDIIGSAALWAFLALLLGAAVASVGGALGSPRDVTVVREVRRRT